MPTIKVTIGRDQAEWLRNHPSINLSGLVQEIIIEEKNKTEPFVISGQMWKNRKRIKMVVTIDSNLHEWLKNLRLMRVKADRIFLSFYVQKRLDYIMSTGIIATTKEFRKAMTQG